MWHKPWYWSCDCTPSQSKPKRESHRNGELVHVIGGFGKVFMLLGTNNKVSRTFVQLVVMAIMRVKSCLWQLCDQSSWVCVTVVQGKTVDDSWRELRVGRCAQISIFLGDHQRFIAYLTTKIILLFFTHAFTDSHVSTLPGLTPMLTPEQCRILTLKVLTPTCIKIWWTREQMHTTVIRCA